MDRRAGRADRRIGTAPRDTHWHADEHTLAKHRVLRSYLEAWIPILATQTGRLVLVDGFAGPGRYLDGEDGSPILMLKAFLEHKQRSAIDAQLEYLFIEKDEDRASYLDNEVRRVLADAGAPMNVTARSIHGEFAANLPTVVAAMGGTRRVSMFVFIDPFGYTGWQLEQSGQILALPRCEVLAFVPLSAERDLLIAAARASEPPFTIEDLDRAGVSEAHSRPILANLQDLGVITDPADRGEYDFTVPGFHSYLLRRAGDWSSRTPARSSS